MTHPHRRSTSYGAFTRVIAGVGGANAGVIVFANALVAQNNLVPLADWIELVNDVALGSSLRPLKAGRYDVSITANTEAGSAITNLAATLDYQGDLTIAPNPVDPGVLGFHEALTPAGTQIPISMNVSFDVDEGSLGPAAPLFRLMTRAVASIDVAEARMRVCYSNQTPSRTTSGRDADAY